MANRYFKQFIKTPDSEMVYLDGYVTLDAGGNVTACSIPHVTAARSAAGIIDLTMADAYPGRVIVHATLFCTQDVALSLQGLGQSASGKLIQLKTVNTSGVPTDTTKSLGIDVSIKVKNSGLAVGS